MRPDFYPEALGHPDALERNLVERCGDEVGRVGREVGIVHPLGEVAAHRTACLDLLGRRRCGRRLCASHSGKDPERASQRGRQHAARERSHPFSAHRFTPPGLGARAAGESPRRYRTSRHFTVAGKECRRWQACRKPLDRSRSARRRSSRGRRVALPSAPCWRACAASCRASRHPDCAPAAPGSASCAPRSRRRCPSAGG